MNKTITDITDKAEALARHLGANINEIVISDPDECRFEIGNEEYLVCEAREADDKAESYIKETLWAFNPQFLIKCMHGLDKLTDREIKDFIEVLKGMQEKMCESCNPMIRLLVRENMCKLVHEAIREDGRGHFLAGYDHEEREEGKYFIYRTN